MPALTAVNTTLPPRLALLFADLVNGERLPVELNARGGLTVAPRTVESVLRILQLARAHGASLSISDGGGPADLIVDLSAHLNSIVRLDPTARTVRVQAGARISAVRAAAAQHGLAFLPQLAVPEDYTIARALHEGLLASGPMDERSDRTTLHAAVLVTYGGDLRRLGPLAKGGATDDPGPAGAELARSLRALGDRYADQIRNRATAHASAIAGYDLEPLLPGHRVNLAQALNGSQGTLGVVVELTCALEPAAAHRRYAVMGFADIAAAAAHSPFVQSFGPNRVAAFDVNFAEQLARTQPAASVAGFPAGNAWLLAEFAAKTSAEATAGAESLVEANSRRFVPVPSAIVDEPPPGKWFEWANDFRSSQFLISCELPDLAAFITDTVDTARNDAFEISIRGDFGGSRVAVDVRHDTADEARGRLFDAAARAAVKHRGLVARASGQGAECFERSASLFGSEMARAFLEFASCFDPTGQMNPAAAQPPNRPPDRSASVDERPTEVIELEQALRTDAFVNAAANVGIAMLGGLFSFRFARWLRAR
jgi:FAD/FMN-containing dehydrogenase